MIIFSHPPYKIHRAKDRSQDFNRFTRLNLIEKLKRHTNTKLDSLKLLRSGEINTFLTKESNKKGNM